MEVERATLNAQMGAARADVSQMEAELAAARAAEAEAKATLAAESAARKAAEDSELKALQAAARTVR